MNDQTDELLNELDGMSSPTASQAEHLMQALKGGDMSKETQTSTSDSASPAASDDFEDLLELMDEEMTTEATPNAPESTPARDDSTSPMSEIEAVALALEAAKAAQEAAENSQKSSELAIKNAHELKAELVELSDSNYAWRQLIKNETKQLKNTKSAVSILVTITLIFSLSAAGVMGYLLYVQNKKFNAFKGEIIDIIQTNNTLFQNKINTKVDELSSLIEALSAKLEKTATLPAAISHSTPVNIHPHTQEATVETQSTQHVEHSAPQSHHTEHTPAAETINASHTEAHTPDYANELGEIKQVIQAILHKQQSLEKLIHQAMQKNKIATHEQSTQQAVIAKLSPEDAKKLAGIRWLIKVQNRQIKQIQAALKQKAYNSAVKSHNLASIQATLKTIQQQVRALQTQQEALQKEVEELKKETQKLSAHRPYIYHAPAIEP